RLIEGNLEAGRFEALTGPRSLPPQGVIGVWSEGRILKLGTELDGRRFELVDDAGRGRRLSSLGSGRGRAGPGGRGAWPPAARASSPWPRSRVFPRRPKSWTRWRRSRPTS